MANIFDYMLWRDIEINKVEFNEIDALILSRLAYFPFDNINLENTPLTIEDAYYKYAQIGDTNKILQKEDIDLFPTLALSKRFGRLMLSNYINKLDDETEKQFSAITIHLPSNEIFVAYRGTDNTLIGWKEDFNMSFKSLVPSQTEAVNYLNDIAVRNKNFKIRVGGHSKGGNLAVYASCFCNENVNERIIAIYNNDGPGFQEEVIQTKEYQKTLNRIKTFIPQTSIIGRLLNHAEDITVLKSTQNGILQHDLYTWQLLGEHFIEDELTNSSEFIDQTVTNWLNHITPEEREKFIDILFEIINATEAKTLSELNSKKIETARILLKTYNNIDDESKEIISKTLAMFFQKARENIRINRK